MSVNSILQSIFDGVAESKWNKNRIRENKFNELKYTNLLFSYEYLDDLVDDCKKKSEYENVLDYLYQFDMDKIESYKEIESKIINKFW